MHKGPLQRNALALGLISSSMLVYEISLTRLFAIQQFHHFAFLVVSLAVVGIAAGGTLLSLARMRLSLGTIAGLYSLAIALAYLTVNFLPFDSYSIAWDARQGAVLLLYFTAAGLPFLLAGLTIASCLQAEAGRAHQLYGANLIGSAIGCLLALLAHAWLGSEGSLALAVSLGMLATLFFTAGRGMRIAIAMLASAAGLISISFPAPMALRLSPYKPLASALLLPDSQHLLSTHSTSARLDLVASKAFHIFPGLSLNAAIALPPQAVFFLDGDGPFPVTQLDPDDPVALNLARHMPSGLAYQMRPAGRVLILSPGAGLEAVLALASGSRSVAISEPEPLITAALQGPLSPLSQELLARSDLSVLHRSDRGALRSAEGSFEIVHFALSDPFRPVASGAYSLGEEYSLTVEAMQEAFRRLSSDGLLVITRWLGTPPSQSARAWATLLQALEAEGLTDVRPHMIAFRGMRTATLIASRQPLQPADLSLARSFTVENGFDLIYIPDLAAEETNRFNILPEDRYHALFAALVEDAHETIRSYDFNLRPATDDRPYFFHFFRWRQTPEVLAGLGTSWQPFGGSGYLVMLILLGLVASMAVPLSLTPLLARRQRVSGPASLARELLYFAMLGAGFMLVEIPLIQRYTLLLDRPATALALVLFTLLLASGLGSLASTRIPLRLALAGLLAALALLIATLPAVIPAAIGWGLPARLAMAAALLALPGFLMGVPFAAGLRRLEQRRPGMIPWAWAVNGAAGGIAGVLAAMISLDWGTRVTLLIGGLAYLVAWFAAAGSSGEAP